jgi:hypothetical protein
MHALNTVSHVHPILVVLNVLQMKHSVLKMNRENVLFVILIRHCLATYRFAKITFNARTRTIIKKRRDVN